MPEKKIRVLVAKPGLDGHDRGAKVIARALRDDGMEVIYTGLRQTPEMIAEAALQEDVDVVGLSILSGAHNALVPQIIQELKDNGQENIVVFWVASFPKTISRDFLNKAFTKSTDPAPTPAKSAKTFAVPFQPRHRHAR